MCLLSLCYNLKSCIISVDLEKALATLFPVQQTHFNLKPSCQIDRGIDIKVPQNKFWYTKYVGYKNVWVFGKFPYKSITRPDLNWVPLSMVKKYDLAKQV